MIFQTAKHFFLFFLYYNCLIASCIYRPLNTPSKMSFMKKCLDIDSIQISKKNKSVWKPTLAVNEKKIKSIQNAINLMIWMILARQVDASQVRYYLYFFSYVKYHWKTSESGHQKHVQMLKTQYASPIFISHWSITGKEKDFSIYGKGSLKKKNKLWNFTILVKITPLKMLL